MKLQRLAATALALLTGFALLLQLFIVLQVRYAAGLSLMGGLGHFFGYFTILTNLLVAVTLSWPLLQPASRLGRLLARADVCTGVATNIALVGLIYSLLLRQIWQPQGAQWLADELLHDVVPVLFLLYWFWAVPRIAPRLAQALQWAVYPMVYLVYALLRGAWFGSYPYPFLDVAKLGSGRVALSSIGVFVVFLAIAFLLMALNQLKPAARAA
jgi:hypothetical protein